MERTDTKLVTSLKMLDFYVKVLPVLKVKLVFQHSSLKRKYKMGQNYVYRMFL